MKSKKICPVCKRPQEDERIVKCETCRVAFVSLAEGLRLLDRDQISALASAILRDWRVRVLWWTIPISIVAGVTVASVFLEWKAGKAVREEVDKLKLSASNQVVAVYSSATNQIAAKFQLFAQDASNQISSAYSAVTNQIAAEFQTPRIQQTVESVARGEAKSILEAEVRPAVDSFRTDAQFQRLATRARAYDFKAYQALLELEKQTNELAGDAQRAVAEIDRTLQRDRSGSAFRRFAIVSGTNVYGGPFTPDELASLFWATQQDKSSPKRESFVNAIHEWKQPMYFNG